MKSSNNINPLVFLFKILTRQQVQTKKSEQIIWCSSRSEQDTQQCILLWINKEKIEPRCFSLYDVVLLARGVLWIFLYSSHSHLLKYHVLVCTKRLIHRDHPFKINNQYNQTSNICFQKPFSFQYAHNM